MGGAVRGAGRIVAAAGVAALVYTAVAIRAERLAAAGGQAFAPSAPVRPRSLTMQTYAAVAAATVAIVVGVALSAPPLKPLSWADAVRTRTADEADARPSFASIRHRGPALFGDADGTADPATKAEY